MSVLTIADIDTAVSAEPRIEDLKLGFSLGMQNPASSMRKLIARHEEALTRFGEVVSTVEKTSAQGGRPGKTSWLNLRQALYLATKSEAENAVDLTVEMVDLFAAVKEGKQVIANPSETAALPFDRSNLSMLRFGGKVVMVDTRKFQVGPDDRVVRLHWDGRLDIGKVLMREDGRYGPRGYLEKARKYRKGDPLCAKRATGISGVVFVLGLVVDEIPVGQPALPKPKKAAKALAVSRKTFDAARFVEDLDAVGCDVGVLTPVPTPGYGTGRPSYVIRAPKGFKTNEVVPVVLDQWSDAIKACPNHEVQVAAYLVACSRTASTALALTRH